VAFNRGAYLRERVANQLFVGGDLLVNQDLNVGGSFLPNADSQVRGGVRLDCHLEWQ
jgi:hypothetical protein